jgi:ribokinase
MQLLNNFFVRFINFLLLKNTMYDVITVGSATVDVFAKTECDLITIKTPNSNENLIAYPSGSKILIDKLEFKIGGGGTNTAVSFSRFNLKTAFLGNLGDDNNAKQVIDLLKNEKIDFVGFKDKDQTGYSIILDSDAKDRTILTNKGANNNLLFKNINKRKLKTKWFYFSSMMGKSLETLLDISKYAKKNKIQIAFNPSSYLIKEDHKHVVELLSFTNVLIFNKEEAELLCGKFEIIDLLKKCHELGPEIVIITDGSKGCFCSDKKYFYSILPRKVKVVETTGAGDAFASSFVSGLIKNKDLEFSLKLGMVNAESVIQGIGAKENLLSYNKALLSMKKFPYKINKKILK